MHRGTDRCGGQGKERGKKKERKKNRERMN